jgi:acyl-CoA thioesterase-1
MLWLVLLLGGPLPAAAEPPTILVMGDSLSSAYGLQIREGWVALLQQRLSEQGYPYKVVNSSIAGETTSGGLSRLPHALSVANPDIVLIELGANDGLRGLSLKQMRANLTRMLELGTKARAKIVLFEMRLPPNYGQPYTVEFMHSFVDVAKAKHATLVPFFLAKTAADPKYLSPDGIHPNAAAQPLLLDAVWPTLQPMLDRD